MPVTISFCFINIK